MDSDFPLESGRARACSKGLLASTKFNRPVACGLGVNRRSSVWFFSWRACLALAVLALAAPAVFAAQNGYWPLDEGSGTSTVDSSGSGNTGTLTNSPTWATGKIGGGLTFNGTTSYVGVNGAGNLADLYQSGMTVMAWIKPNSTGGGGFGRIVDKGNTANSNGWWFTMYTSSTLRLQVAQYGSPVATRESGASISMGVWQHVAVTWDGSKNGTGMHMYVNGVLSDGATTNATGTAQSDAAIALAIGNRASDGARGFDGGIDDVRIYNQVLTAAQIQAIANDSQVPTAPTSPSASPASSTQINVSWTASTDNVGVTGYRVERCQGSSCTNFAQVATPSGTTFNDSGLTASTTYRYRIRATDAAGLLGPYSSIASGTTPAGGGSSVAAASYWPTDEGSGTTTVDASGHGNTGTLTNSPTWTTGKIGGGLSFNGTTPYVSVNGAGNLANLYQTGMTVMAWIKPNSVGGGGFGRIVDKGNTANSNGWWFTMYTPTTLRLQVAQYGSPVAVRESGSAIAMGVWQHVAATWDGSKNGTGMHLYVNGVLSDGATGNATGSVQSDSGITLGIGNRVSDGARGFDGAIDDVRIYNQVLTATQVQAIASDSQVPTAPTSPSATAASSTQINVTWTASTDNVGVVGYLVERCQGTSCTNFVQVATPSGSPLNDTGLTASTTYRYRVRATDAAGLLGAYSSIVSAATQSGGGGDTQPPTAPSGLNATAVSSSQINLSWAAATDNVGVTGYHVERCQGSSCTTFSEIGTPTGTTFNDPGLAASTTYRYQVRANDAVPLLGPYSNIASATTQAPGDTTPPTAPTNLMIVAASSNEIDLVWTGSSDNVAVTSYVVQRCAGASCSNFAPAGTVSSPTPPATFFYNAGLTASTSYSYRVIAMDAATNPSLPSNVVTYQTPTASPDCN